jgi:hypothetical protein
MVNAPTEQLKHLVHKWVDNHLARTKTGAWADEGPTFPTNTSELEQLLRTIAPKHNIRQIHAGGWWRAIQRIDSRVKGLGLVACLDDFVSRLLTIPPAPEHAMGIAAQNSKQRWEQRALRCATRMFESFEGSMDQPLKTTESSDDPSWDAIYVALLPFTSPRFQSVFGARPFDVKGSAEKSLIARLSVWAALTDVQLRSRAWWQRQQRARDFAIWIHSLNNPEHNASLTKIFPFIDFSDHVQARLRRLDPKLRRADHRQRKRWEATRANRLSLQHLGQDFTGLDLETSQKAKK